MRGYVESDIERSNWSIDSLITVVAGLTVVFVPAIPHLSGLDNNLPSHPNMARSTAGAFTSLAYARDPVGQFFYNTPHESMASIHLHSILSAPLVAIGYVEGGRLVSFVAGLAAVALLYALGRRLWTPVAGLGAAAGIWIHPLFQTRLTLFQPEMLSIAVTVGLVLVTLQYLDLGCRLRRWILFVGLAVAPAIHLWEAVVLVPIAALLIDGDKLREAAIATLVTVGAVLIYFGVTHLQPRSGSRLIEVYATWNRGNWQLLLNADWWFPEPLPLSVYVVNPKFVLHFIDGATLVLGLFLAVLATLAAINFNWRRDLILLASWSSAGVLIPLLLSRGALTHPYYVWAIVPALALSLGFIVDRLRREISTVHSPAAGKAAALTMALLLVVTGVGSAADYGDRTQLTFDSGMTPSQQAAEELRERGITDPGRLVFVGEQTSELTAKDSFALRTLLYAGIPVRTNKDLESGTGIEIIRDPAAFDGCSSGDVVIFHGDGVSVEACS